MHEEVYRPGKNRASIGSRRSSIAFANDVGGPGEAPSEQEGISMNRREALRAGIGLIGVATVTKIAPAFATREPQANLALKDAAICRKRLTGVSIDKASLQDPSVSQFVVRNFNLLTASGMKWDAVHPEPNRYDFSEGDWNVQFAEQHGMQVHGHNLCWNSPAAYPAWFKAGLNSSNAKELLTEHITTVVKRYSGRISSWDVVNEPVVPWSKRSDGLYPGVWLSFLGPTYIDTAFHTTAAADPKALRILNIYNVEQGTPDHEKTRANTIELLKQLLGRGVPVQAVGIESHLDASQPLGGASFRQFLNDVRALKLEVVITELDVKENRVGSSMDWDKTAAQYYGEYLRDVTSTVNPPFLIFWSAKDRWENGKRIQGLMQNNLSPRLTYQAAIDVLGHASCG
jgi:endo-1,4-beta-xylanase